jgi:hypothetical protein
MLVFLSFLAVVLGNGVLAPVPTANISAVVTLPAALAQAIDYTGHSVLTAIGGKKA